MKLFFHAAIALFLTTTCARAVPVTLRVADAQGQPIAGATARVVDYDNWADDANKLSATVEARADGIFAFDLRGTAGDPKLLSASENGVPGLNRGRRFVGCRRAQNRAR